MVLPCPDSPRSPLGPLCAPLPFSLETSHLPGLGPHFYSYYPASWLHRHPLSQPPPCQDVLIARIFGTSQALHLFRTNEPFLWHSFKCRDIISSAPPPHPLEYVFSPTCHSHESLWVFLFMHPCPYICLSAPTLPSLSSSG